MTYNLLERIELIESLKRLIYLQKRAANLTDIIKYYNEIIALKQKDLNLAALGINQINEMLGLNPEYSNPNVIHDLIIYLRYGAAKTLEEAIDFYEKHREEHIENL